MLHQKSLRNPEVTQPPTHYLEQAVKLSDLLTKHLATLATLAPNPTLKARFHVAATHQLALSRELDALRTGCTPSHLTPPNS